MKPIFSRSAILVTTVFTLLLLVVTAPSYSQVWTDFNEHDPGIVSLEVMIPSLDDGFGTEAPTSAFEVYSRFPIGGNAKLIVAVPFSHLSPGTGDSETAIGNPYIGVRSNTKSSGISFEGGVRLPLAPNLFDNAGIITGLLIENHTLGRFIPETTTLNGTVRYHYEQDSGFIFRVGGGPDVWFIKDADTELVLNYYTQLLYRPNNFSFGAGFAGLALISGGDLNFGDRTVGDIGIISSYHFGNARAGAYLRLPLDENVSDAVNFVLGLHVGVVL